MELKNFLTHFLCDEASELESSVAAESPHAPANLSFLWEHFPGRSFNDGLYRIMSKKHLTWSIEFVALAFPHLANTIICFSYDWLGRLFALDLKRVEQGDQAILMLEPGTGQSLEIPANMESFHNNELIVNADAALASSFYHNWRASGGVAPKIGECIGYRKLLFLGGEDSIRNLELTDIEVYWHLSAQLIEQVHGLQRGVKIHNISIA